MSPTAVHRGIAAAVSATALLLAAACGSGDSGTGTSGGGNKVAAVIMGLDNPFFQSMEQGIEDQAKTAGTEVTVQAANSITDTTGQADKLTGLAGQDYGCYIVNPISGTNLIQGMAQLAAQKKAIVNIDSPVDAAAAKAANATPATYIGTNNTSAGEKAGQQMVTLLPGGGEVAAIGGIAGDVTSGQRVDGFTKAITGKLDLVQTVAANWERQEALTQATNIMRAQPGLKGFFVANDDMGLGVARAVQTAGKAGQIKIISVDGIKDALTAVQNGEIDAVVAQYPYTIGQMGMEACQAIAKGATVPASVEAPVEVVTEDNAGEALAATPKPFGAYDDPFTTLLGS
ncbi:substrate-binding domain-containing protein [Actinoplanes sp. NPDC023714]|uniref:substrate-binding domain-containing protein n=1 Tax=Actinoplanes sp. NPDC023714 TaxID=3154322 RepID=UPI00340E6C58